MGRKLAKSKFGHAQNFIKVTIRLDLEVAQKLGCESAMTRRSQSAIVQDALRAHLKHRRLPGIVSTVEQQESPRIDSGALEEGLV
jgi:predicted transcriptional regulator